MENRIVVGLLVGIVLAGSLYVWNSDSFTKQQKIILVFFTLFPPFQWIGIIAILVYKNYKENNTIERIAEKNVEQRKNDFDNSISTLKDLMQKGILSEDECKQKISKIEAEKTQENLKNSIEYKQLKKLLDSNVLTKEEFEKKVKLLKVEDEKKDIEFIKNNANDNILLMFVILTFILVALIFKK